ncbi:putative secreted protein (Por secretion system target) [Mariniflexile fucanivorans]|uniref:Putative secreted protein (Por secretion system target) n=1 Tax=Mariniflexile fucanivorans TaxID=264023 RepID=A0A4R1RHV0_9FLAO|nr:zinc-dependent metalloprotease family protein [Mariniflexile fucanivorans]TCL65653.1 putative secreted protein (Por secretion system target) [Mariniflexile fucanivorans]
MKAKLHYVLSIAMLLVIFSASAQNSSWKKSETLKDSKIISKLNLDKKKVHVFELNTRSLKESLFGTISRSSKAKQKTTTVSIPGDAGELETFQVYEASVFSPELAAKYPNIKSYVGVSTNNSGTRLRMSVSPQGVQTMISYTDNSMVFMQPTSKGSNEYVLYDKSSKEFIKDRFKCSTLDEVAKTFNKSSSTSKTTLDEGGANNQKLQKFRIAISTTAEYTAYHNDGNDLNGDAVADALAAINATLSRVNDIFETDMAVTFELIDATQLIYTNASTDPYSDANIGADEDVNRDINNLNGWSIQLQNNLTNTIGNAAYDIGHLFGATGGGGNSGCIGCVCDDDSASNNDRNKGSAFTSPSNGVPEGDTFDLDFVIHEIGHQMGANHTFAFDIENTNVNSEPGSGTTIMAYAGITGLDDVALNSDPYFHYHSIKQILNTLSTKSCQTKEDITNNPPIANAGADYNIPAGTAYILKGSATDADGGDNLTYCWEQMDSGLVNYLNFGSDLTSGSTNRSLPPSSEPNRYIPKFSSVIAGNIIQTEPTLGSDWETVSSVGRTLNWALTVRDRNPLNPSGAQSSFDTMKITVEDVTPFTVSNPISWAQGSNVTINWEVGQTANASINCQNVTIKLSIDGGLTFPITVASNAPNSGTYIYTVPSITNTSTARLLVEAADNIFYDVSDFDFSISPEQDFFMVDETLDPIACAETTATFHFNYVTANGFSENTVFSASGNPGSSTVTFSPASLSASGSVTMTISNLGGVSLDDYPITLTGTATTITKNKDIDFPFYNGVCKSVANNQYKTSTTLVQFNTINNTSGKTSGYKSYTNISTDINRDSAYNLVVNANTDGDYTTATKVWIDWNQNCSFNDAGEEYVLGDTTNSDDGQTGNSPFSITVPVTALLGNTTMRVSTKFKSNGQPTACENGFDGEVEDYTLNIVPTLAIEEFGFENFIVFPNPNTGTFSIQLNGSLERAINVSVFDMRGRYIFEKEFPNVGDFRQEIQLNKVQSGMYLLIVSDGVRKSTKKIVIE